MDYAGHLQVPMPCVQAHYKHIMIGRAYESHLQVLRHVYKHITTPHVQAHYDWKSHLQVPAPRVQALSGSHIHWYLLLHRGGGVLQNITASFHLQINLKAAITAAFSYKTNLINSQLS